MFRRATIAAVTVAVVATSALTVTTTDAFAKNGRNGAFAAGAIFGLATGAIIGSTANDRYYGDPYYDGRTYYRPRYRECWEQPVRRWDPYLREKVVVGYKTVCR